MAPLWLSLLLLYFGLQFVAGHLPQQEGETQPCYTCDSITVSVRWGRISSNLTSVIQTRRSMEKVLDWENSRLYHKVSSESVNKYGCAYLVCSCIILLNVLELSCILFVAVLALETKQKEM